VIKPAAAMNFAIRQQAGPGDDVQLATSRFSFLLATSLIDGGRKEYAP